MAYGTFRHATRLPLFVARDVGETSLHIAHTPGYSEHCFVIRYPANACLRVSECVCNRHPDVQHPSDIMCAQS